MEDFLVKDLSRTYIQMIRERSDETFGILNDIRIGVIKMLAPVIPFTTEKIWQELRSLKLVPEESIHLSNLPTADKKMIDEKLQEEFDVALQIIEKGLAERDKEKIGLRWPLASATYETEKIISKDIEEIIAMQLNVKKIKRKSIKNNVSLNVVLDVKMTPELEAEGFAREISRRVQVERKKNGLKKEDMIDLKIGSNAENLKILRSQEKFLKERTNSKSIEFIVDKIIKNGVVFQVKEKEFSLLFS